VAALIEVGWSVVHLSLVVSERLAAKQIADSSFELSAHMATLLASLSRTSNGPSTLCERSNVSWFDCRFRRFSFDV
jgi:hypothetical protein